MTSTAPPSTPLLSSPAAARRAMIARRQKESSVWWIIHRLGSLNFALILLATIGLACAAATFAESGFNTKIAHTYFYKNPLFILWLAALCVNLFAVTLTRWPWQKKHTGFIVTHYGIILLLTGAVIGMQTGYEGNVTLKKDGAPLTRVVTSRSIIQVESPTDHGLYLMSFDAETAQPSAESPRTFAVPGTDWKIIADDFSDNLVQKNSLVPDPEGPPAVLLRLSTAMMNQSVDMPLFLQGDKPVEEDFFGLARIIFQSDLPDVIPLPEHETQIVFAQFAPVIESGKFSSGLQLRLSEDGEKVTIISPDGNGTTYLRREIMKQVVPMDKDAVTVEEYWPDFVMKDGRPTSRSTNPANPAILARISPKTDSSSDAKPHLTLAPTDGGIRYQLGRGKSTATSGIARVGDSFALGWADWRAEVVQVLPHARLETETIAGPPAPKNAPGIPGFLAHLETAPGESGLPAWVESGKVTTLRSTKGSESVRIAYGLESKPVPFSIRLLRFDIPRDEGTDTPADFRATVEFKDATTGAITTGVARMNHPASFPGTFWSNVTGLNYKFSQAEWNPKDLDETTLQVLHDPGWMFKWMGSLAICLGIAIMFYWKPGGA